MSSVCLWRRHADRTGPDSSKQRVRRALEDLLAASFRRSGATAGPSELALPSLGCWLRQSVPGQIASALRGRRMGARRSSAGSVARARRSGELTCSSSLSTIAGAPRGRSGEVSAGKSESSAISSRCVRADDQSGSTPDRGRVLLLSGVPPLDARPPACIGRTAQKRTRRIQLGSALHRQIDGART